MTDQTVAQSNAAQSAFYAANDRTVAAGPDDDGLREWALAHVGSLAAKAMAEDMPGVHGAPKGMVIDWILDNDPDRLAESRRLSTRGGS